MLALALVLKRGAGLEDDMLHVRDSEATLVSRQTQVARTLRVLDRWGKAITVVAVIYGVALLARLLYQVWEEGQHLSVN